MAMIPVTCKAHRLLLVALLGALAVTGCGRKDNVVQGPDALYERAEKSLGNGNYANAIFYLEQLEARYPFSNFSKQAQLDLVYAYYRNVEPESAGDAADQFMRENPTHPRVDYCLYMKGVIFFDQDANFLEKLFRVDMSERPPRNTMRAFSAFQELLRRFRTANTSPTPGSACSTCVTDWLPTKTTWPSTMCAAALTWRPLIAPSTPWKIFPARRP